MKKNPFLKQAEVAEAIIKYAEKNLKKIATKIKARSDHFRHKHHPEEVTVEICRNPKDITKTMAKLNCACCKESLHSIDLDDIASAVVNSKLAPCPMCGKEVRISEMGHGDQPNPWFTINCTKCDLNSGDVGTVCNYEFNWFERYSNRLKLLKKWNTRPKIRIKKAG